MNYKKPAKFIIIALIFLSVLFLSGCWSSKELNDIAIVLGIGIDKSNEQGKIDMTVEIAKSTDSKSKKGDSKEQTKAYETLKESGETVFGTIKEFSHISSRVLFLPQSHFIIFGKELAESGINPYIDFFARDNEVRMDMYVIVAQGSANDIFNTEPLIEKTPSNELFNLIQEQDNASYTTYIELMTFIKKIKSDHTAALATLVSINQKEDKSELYLEGMAVFKKDKMVGTLNQSETRGYLCVSNLIKDGVIDIDADNGKACLEFLKTKCKTNVEISDEGKLKVNLTVTQDSTIGELDGFEGLEMEDIINKLETEGAEAIKNEINASIDHAKKLNADYFGFNEAFEKKYGNKWKEYKDKWDRLFPELEINVNVKVTIKGSGRITVLDMLKEEK